MGTGVAGHMRGTDTKRKAWGDEKKETEEENGVQKEKCEEV